jgi:SAM-dependent methyltransferase
MRAEFLRAVPRATVLDATAEAIPLAAGSVDAVTAAQSFHWFATDRVLAELHRVLCPEGGLGLIWNRRDMRDPIQVALDGIIAPLRAGTPSHENDRWMDLMQATNRFVPIGQQQFTYEQVLDRGGLIDRVLSISFIALLDAGRREAIARQVEAVAGQATEFRLPYRTDVYLFRRTDP